MEKYIEIALNEAKKSLKTDDVPIGAVIVENNKIIAKALNCTEPTAQRYFTGAIVPPRYSALSVTAQNVVAVPISMMMSGPPYLA